MRSTQIITISLESLLVINTFTFWWHYTSQAKHVNLILESVIFFHCPSAFVSNSIPLFSMKTFFDNIQPILDLSWRYKDR